MRPDGDREDDEVKHFDHAQVGIGAICDELRPDKEKERLGEVNETIGDSK